MTLPRRDQGARAWLAAATTFAVAGQVANLVHAAGHVVGGRLVGAPMDELLLTGTRIATIYRGEQAGLPPRVHLGRALGGPAANLALALLLTLPAALLPAGRGREIVRLLLNQTLLAGLGALLPLPSVDGEVVWREVRRQRQGV